MSGFDAFISYSHSADGKLAPSLQAGLQRMAKPWNRRRALEVFRDQTGLSVTPHLWGAITGALDTAQWFVLLASPESAASEWVGREIEYWLASRPDARERILPVVTGGVWDWADEGGFTAESTAVNPALHGVFTDEPLYLDLTWAKNAVHLDLESSRFREAVAQLAAPMHGTTKDELVGEDVRQFKIARRLRRGAEIGLATLTVGALIATVVAVQQRGEARDQRNEAVAQRAAAEANAAQARSRELAALALDTMADDPGLAPLIALEANYPNGAMVPIDVPEARTSLGVTLRNAAGSTVRQVGARLASSTISGLVYADEHAIATFDGLKGTVAADGSQAPPDWWDADTGSAIESPLPFDEEMRLMAPVGKRLPFTDVLVAPEIGTTPVGEPVAVDASTGTLFGIDLVTGEVIGQPVDGGAVTMRGTVPAGVDIVDLVNVSGGLVFGRSADGHVYRWSAAGGIGEDVFGNDLVVRSMGAAPGGLVLERGQPFLAPTNGTEDVARTDLAAVSDTGDMLLRVATPSPTQMLGLDPLSDAEPTVPGSFAVSPDGRYVAAIAEGDGFDQPVVVWDLSSTRRVATISTAQPVQLLWGGNDRLAVASYRGVEQFQLIPRTVDVALPADGLSMSADGTSVAISSTVDGVPLVVRGPLSSVPPVDSFDAVRFGVTALDTTGAVVAASTYRPAGTVDIAVARVADGTQLATFPDAYAAAFSPDGRTLALGGAGMVTFVSTDTWQPERIIELGTDVLGESLLTWTPDGSGLVAAVDLYDRGEVYWIDATTGASRSLWPDTAAGIRFSPDGSRLALGSTDGIVELWPWSGPTTDLAAVTPTSFVSGSTAITGLAFSPDGRRLVASSQTGTVVWEVTDLAAPRRVQVVTALPMWSFRPQTASQLGGVSLDPVAEGEWGQVAFRPDGRSFVMAGPSGMVEVPDFDPALACRQASIAELDALQRALGAPSVCTRVPSLAG